MAYLDVMSDGIFGSDGTLSCPLCKEPSAPIGENAYQIRHKPDCPNLKAQGHRMLQKKPCLWVAYTLHVTTGHIMASDGFFDGQLPLTPIIMTDLRTQIAKEQQKNIDKMKPVDQQGKVVLNAPKPKIGMIQISCIMPAEVDEIIPETAVN